MLVCFSFFGRIHPASKFKGPRLLSEEIPACVLFDQETIGQCSLGTESLSRQSLLQHTFSCGGQTMVWYIIDWRNLDRSLSGPNSPTLLSWLQLSIVKRVAAKRKAPFYWSSAACKTRSSDPSPTPFSVYCTYGNSLHSSSTSCRICISVPPCF